MSDCLVHGVGAPPDPLLFFTPLQTKEALVFGFSLGFSDGKPLQDVEGREKRKFEVFIPWFSQLRLLSLSNGVSLYDTLLPGSRFPFLTPLGLEVVTAPLF